jgi:hypothetical protein
MNEQSVLVMSPQVQPHQQRNGEELITAITPATSHLNETNSLLFHSYRKRVLRKSCIRTRIRRNQTIPVRYRLCIFRSGNSFPFLIIALVTTFSP